MGFKIKNWHVHLLILGNHQGDGHSHLVTSAFTFCSDSAICSKIFETNLQKLNKTRKTLSKENLLAAKIII